MYSIIGIVGNLLTMEKGAMLGVERDYVNDDYIKVIEQVGGIPVILPVVDHDESIKGQLDVCDGIIISGGPDVNPVFYGEDPHEALGFSCMRVDDYQLRLTKLAIDYNKPVLGICRGHQVLNVACGGTLYQDLSEMPGKVLKHFQDAKRYDPTHKVNISPGSCLSRLFSKTIFVNSFHHQCIKDMGNGLIIAASARDGTIEAIEMPNKKFVVGIQWHPEMISVASDDMLILFQEFLKYC